MSQALRVGCALDVHAFAGDAAHPLMLAGVHVPGEVGLAGHSDADVVLHAVCDALLGAAALGDLGELFGSCDPAYAAANSQVFLDEVCDRLANAGWAANNVDCTVVAERPRLGPHRQAMRDSLAALLTLPADRVSVKATSTDRLGAIGRAEGIACYAVASLVERSA